MTSPFIPSPFIYGDIPGGGQLAVIVVATTAPTVAQNQQVPGTFWLNPEPAGSGNLYFLAGFVNGVPQWELLGTASGDVVSLSDTSGTLVTPSGTGNIQLLGTANQISVTSGSHLLTFALIGPYTPATYTAHGVLIGEGTSSIVATAAGTNGQVLLGSTGADPAFGTLTTSTGIAYTTGAAALAIDVKTNGFAVVDQATGSVALAAQTMYITDDGAALVTYTLPATVARGTTIKIVGLSAGGWKIAQNAGQTISLNANVSTSGAGGSVSSTNKNNSVTLVATDATTNGWVITESSGGALTFV